MNPADLRAITAMAVFYCDASLGPRDELQLIRRKAVAWSLLENRGPPSRSGASQAEPDCAPRKPQEVSMFRLSVVDHVRLNFGHAVQNYTVHAQAAERLARSISRIRMAVLGLLGLSA